MLFPLMGRVPLALRRPRLEEGRREVRITQSLGETPRGRQLRVSPIVEPIV